VRFCLGLVLILMSLYGAAARADCVVLLHGLARTPGSMAALADAFSEHGYAVVNVGYPSRSKPIEELAPLAVSQGLAGCPENTTVHFVTHSLGGILVRYYLETHDIADLGRVVMLAPPNQGSEVVDRIKGIPGFRLLNGPAGAQLGTDENSVPLQLGPVEFELGVIAGSETFNPILSLYLPNPDDGKVSVASTRVQGMKDFLVVPHSHTFMMQIPEVIEQTLLFIETGAFDASRLEDG
jgi:pimeloyl-ACP methyl ester carboxylesterase